MFQLGSSSRAVAERVGHQPHRGARREDVGAARAVFLQDVVLDRAAQSSLESAPCSSATIWYISSSSDAGRVDRHRGRDILRAGSIPRAAGACRRACRSTRRRARPRPRRADRRQSRPSCVGRSKATLSPVWPRSSRRRKRRFVSSAEEKPAYWRIVQQPAAIHVGIDAARVRDTRPASGLLARVACSTEVR